MKVFVTGHKGYIGVHLVDLLKQAGHTVTGCDLGLFDGCAWEKTVPADRSALILCGAEGGLPGGSAGENRLPHLAFAPATGPPTTF